MPGTFTFRPIQATLTHDTEWLGKMDPYCSYRVGPDRIKGPVCRNGGKFPKWEDATVNVPATNDQSIVVDLMDKDKVLFDDNIGSFVIDLQEVQSRGQISKWYPVYWKQKPAGEILLEAAYQPGFVQQPEPIVEQPVLVKETIVQPVVVEKVVKEQIVETPVQKEFVSGPIIHGISQIHHGGQGIGLVPQHGSILTEGTHHGGVIQGGSISHQGDFYQGTHLHHGTQQSGMILGSSNIHQSTTHGQINQGSLNQGQLHQGSLDQGVLNQGSLNQGVLNQGSMQQGEFSQGSLNQGQLHQGNLNQGQLNQGSLNQGNLGQNQF